MAKGGRGGRRGGGGLNPADIISTENLISQREGKRVEVDEVLTAFRNVNRDFGYVINDIVTAKLKPKAQNVMAYYDREGNIGINENFFNKKAMTGAYDRSVEQGFHPKRGRKPALEATAAHELGHALTDKVADNLGYKSVGKLDIAAEKIVKEARTLTKHRGVVQMASKISTYATYSNSEAIAEAYADVYCNGNRATSESKAIVNTLKKYL